MRFKWFLAVLVALAVASAAHRVAASPGFSSPIYLECANDSLVQHLSSFDISYSYSAGARAAKLINPDLKVLRYFSPTSHTNGGATPQFTADGQWRAYVTAQGLPDSVAENLYLHFSDTTTVRYFRCAPWAAPATCSNVPCAGSCANSYGCFDKTYLPGSKVPMYDFVNCAGGTVGVSAPRWITTFKNPLSRATYRNFLLSLAREPLPGGTDVFPDGLFLDNAGFNAVDPQDRIVLSGGHFQEAGPTVVYQQGITQPPPSGQPTGFNRWLRGPGKWNVFCKELKDSLNAEDPKKFLARNVAGDGSRFFFADTCCTSIPVYQDSLFRQDLLDFAVLEYNGALEIGGNSTGNIDWPMLMYKREKLSNKNALVVSASMVNVLGGRKCTESPTALCVSIQRSLYGLGALAYATASTVEGDPGTEFSPLVGRQNTYGGLTCHVDAVGDVLNPCVSDWDACYVNTTSLPMWDALQDSTAACYLGEPIGDLVLHQGSTVNGRAYKIWRRDYDNGKVFVRTMDSGATTSDSVLTSVLVDPPDMNSSPMFQKVLPDGSLQAAVETFQMPAASGLIVLSAAGAPDNNYYVRVAVPDTVAAGTAFWADVWVRSAAPWRAAAIKVFYDSTRVMPVRYDFTGAPATRGCMAEFDDITIRDPKQGTKLADADLWMLYDKTSASADSQMIGRVQFFPFATGSAQVTTADFDLTRHQFGANGLNGACTTMFSVFNSANTGAAIITNSAGTTYVTPSNSAWHTVSDAVIVATGVNTSRCDAGNWDGHPPKEGGAGTGAQVGATYCAPLAVVFSANDSTASVSDTLTVTMRVWADSVSSIEGFVEYTSWCDEDPANWQRLVASAAGAGSPFDGFEVIFDYDASPQGAGALSYRISRGWLGSSPPSITSKLAWFRLYKINGAKVSIAGAAATFRFVANCQDVFEIGLAGYDNELVPGAGRPFTYIGNGVKQSWTRFNYGNVPLSKGATYVYETARHAWLNYVFLYHKGLTYTWGE